MAGEDCNGFLNSQETGCAPRGGTLALGASCLNDWQCSTGFCTATALTCGVCGEPLPEGAACDPTNNQCARFLGCGSSAAGGTPVVCQKSVAVGDACGLCPLGSYCDPGTQRCVAAPGLGESCDTGVTFLCDLQSGAICDSTTLTCVAGPTVVQPGASCAGNVRCAGSCVTQADGSQLCQPYAQIGELCDTERFCANGLACDQGLCGTCGTAAATAFQGAGPARLSPALLARLPARLRDARAR